MTPEDRKYCEEMLPEVSRTFALGISLLREPLSLQIGVAYLICRILDSVEDTNAVAPQIRFVLLRKMALGLCHPQRDALLQEIKAIFPESKFTGAEMNLLHNTGRVMAVFDSFPANVQSIIQDCAKEMAEGMAATVSREIAQRLEGLNSFSDLCEYCYYVAGTVGKLLTRLFANERPGIEGAVRKSLERREIAFSLGLQLTNILKGIYEDHERGVVYLPLNLMNKYGLKFDNLLLESHRVQGTQLVVELIGKMRNYLDQAMEYTLTVPSSESDIRLFCTLPILFALRTLKLAKEHPSAVLTTEPLKITRKEVKELHIEADKAVLENARLQRLFDRERNF